MANLPSGTVTFLMTDIEGSTNLWELHPEAMQEAILAHDQIVENAISAGGGWLIKSRGEGDSAFSVFTDAASAIQAAMNIQLNILRDASPLPDPLRIRIALHTGEAVLRDGDYYGAVVNRCARLRSIAHGGQTIMSAATAYQAGEKLPEHVELLDLAQHRLRGSSQPEHVFQMHHPELPADFPPLTSLDQNLHNLPAVATSIIGREQELAEIKTLIIQPDVRLITLTGPGGIGKTALATQAAMDLASEFGDGVFYVALAAETDPGLVLASVGQVLGIRQAGDQALAVALADLLRGKRVLLVLDNFEHLLPAASQIAALLAGSPGLTLLVTSRSPLRVSGERLYAVPAMQVPPDGEALDVDALSRYESIRLFVERARAVRSDFELDTDNADSVRAICQRVGGLPLAIELAAARVRVLSPQAMLRRLTAVLPMLTSSAVDVPTRQQTLRGAIAWSYDLLDGPEQKLFRGLSTFVDGSTLDALEFVFQPGDLVHSSSVPRTGSIDALDALSALVDASLIEQHEMADGEPRYGMLEVIREFGREQLDLAGEADVVVPRHAAFYLDLAARAEPDLQGPVQKAWFDRLQTEHGNLRAAMSWFRDTGEYENFARVAAALFWFWIGLGHWTEALGWFNDVLTRYVARTKTRAKALYGAGLLKRTHGDYPGARLCFQESIEISREIDDQPMVARALHFLGGLTTAEGNPAVAREHLQEALEIAQDANDEWTIAVVMRDLGLLFAQDGDAETARRYLEESARIHHVRGEQWAEAHAYNALGDFMRSLAMYDKARAAYEESLKLFGVLGTKDGRPSVLHNLAYVAHNQGDCDHAIRLFQESLQLFKDLGDQRGMAECMAGIAGVLGSSNQAEEAAWLFGASQSLLDDSGTQISNSNLTDYGRNLVSVSLALDDEIYTEATERGRRATLDEAIARAIAAKSSLGI